MSTHPQRYGIHHLVEALLPFLLLCLPHLLRADSDKNIYGIVSRATETSTLRIPKIDHAPLLEEFLQMKPSPAWEGKLAEVHNFIQRLPDDGQPATEPTEAYLGYDSKALHIIFVAHDRQPKLIRARLSRREAIAKDEDQVGIYLDTFRDRRTAYLFACNPIGVQYESLYSQDSDAEDIGFDTVWDSEGKLTSEGYVLKMSIPFKSLRFTHEDSQLWNVALWRYIGRRSEGSWWPRVSSQYRGVLNQTAPMSGMEGLSASKDLQLIPYTSLRASNLVDSRDPAHLSYTGKDAQALTGLDAKAVLKNSLVLDMTVKPDFHQVESDDPQVTTNQLYSLYSPEKRPFFTENSSYFEAPMVNGQHLFYSRTIVDPEFGTRLTGKQGHYSIGALFANDRSPGETVPRSSPLAGKKAFFDIFRITHDLPHRSNAGITFGERHFAGSSSRVVDIDTTFNIGETWIGTVLGAYTWNRAVDGKETSGPDVDATLTRVSRGFNYIGYLLNRSPGFQPAMAFYNHSNWREVGQTFAYQFWPQNPWITRIWTEVYGAKNWHYNGDLNWQGIKPMLKADIKHNTTVTAYFWRWQDAFGSEDLSYLTKRVTLPVSSAYGLGIKSTQARLFTLNVTTEWGQRSNVYMAGQQPPAPATYRQAEVDLSLFLSRGLSVTNTYLFDSNKSAASGQAMYNAHFLKSNWNWQFSRELSLRFIGQYNATLATPSLTTTPTARNFNADVLVTYLVHPGTALYVGYNSNLSKPGPAMAATDPNRFTNDGRQFFVKLSYLLRF